MIKPDYARWPGCSSFETKLTAHFASYDVARSQTIIGVSRLRKLERGGVGLPLAWMKQHYSTKSDLFQIMLNLRACSPSLKMK